MPETELKEKYAHIVCPECGEKLGAHEHLCEKKTTQEKKQ